MYCRNCGTEIPVDTIACGKCGWDPRKGASFCWNCGKPVEQGAIMCTHCGAALQQQSQILTSTGDKKLIAGILAIVLGCLGIHKFILGYTNAGIIMLACTLGGYLLGTALGFLIVPLVLFLAPLAMTVIGIIEGIMYLTKSDAEFHRIYVRGQKTWF